MINVNKITATLAKLEDPDLQQYTALHKNDPYIVALAMSESNRRKEMRAAGQGSMQEQPKVVDKMLAEMAPQQLPEDQGIGQLPAGNMNFAGGGIIAFADGGDVERYAPGGTVYDPVTGVPISAENVSGNDLTFLESIGVFNPENRRALEKADRAEAQKAAALPYNRATMPAAGYTRTDPRAAGATTFADSVKALDAAPTADTTRRPAPGAGAGAAAGATKLPSISDLTALRQQISDKQDFKDPAAAGLLELEARERAAAAADKQAIERDAERFKDAYKGREARLAEREADIGKQKESNTGLALLNAGLAIMSTPGGLATAIGKGARVGTAQFSAGLDKIRSAQERLGDARDRLDDLKLNREESTAKEIRAAENNYRRVSIDAQKRTIDGIRMAADVNEKRATDIYSKTVDMTKTMYEQQQANARSSAGIAAQLNTPDRILFDQLLKKNDNDAVKALEAFKVAKGDKFDVRSSYADYLKAFAGKEGLTPPMSMGAYAGQFGATLPR